MELANLLNSLAEGGFSLTTGGCSADGSPSLELRGPVATLMPELRDALRQHKPTLVAMLDTHAERVAIQQEADAPAGAEHWPDGFSIWQRALDLLENEFPSEVLAELRQADVCWGIETTDVADMWRLLSPSQVKELTAKREHPPRCTFCGGIQHHHPDCISRPTAGGGKHSGKPLDKIPERYLAFLVSQRLGRANDRRAYLAELQRRYVKYREGEWHELEKELALEEVKQDFRQQSRCNKGEAITGHHPATASNHSL